MKRKVLSVVLVLILALSVMPMSVLAAEEYVTGVWIIFSDGEGGSIEVADLTYGGEPLREFTVTLTSQDGSIQVDVAGGIGMAMFVSAQLAIPANEFEVSGFPVPDGFAVDEIVSVQFGPVISFFINVSEAYVEAFVVEDNDDEDPEEYTAEYSDEAEDGGEAEDDTEAEDTYEDVDDEDIVADEDYDADEAEDAGIYEDDEDVSEVPFLRFVIGSADYTVNGVPHVADAPVFIDEVYNRTMVPLRNVAQAMGAEVYWQSRTRWAVITLHGHARSLAVDESLPGGYGMPVIINGRTFVPLAFVAEMFNLTPVWDGVNRAVYLYQ